MAWGQIHARQPMAGVFAGPVITRPEDQAQAKGLGGAQHRPAMSATQIVAFSPLITHAVSLDPSPVTNLRLIPPVRDDAAECQRQARRSLEPGLSKGSHH